MYKILYSDIVITKDISSLDLFEAKIIKNAITQKFKKNPLIFGKPLQYSYFPYRTFRVGDFRVIFFIEKDEKILKIIAIGHRKNIYKMLGKRI